MYCAYSPCALRSTKQFGCLYYRRDFQVVCYCHYAPQEDIYVIRHLATIVCALPITRSHLFCLCIAHEWEDIWYTICAGIDVVSMDGPSFSDFEWQPARQLLWVSLENNIITNNIIIISIIIMSFYCAYYQQVSSSLNSNSTSHPGGGEPWEVWVKWVSVIKTISA